MGRRYAVPFELAAVATGFKTAGLMVGGTAIRPRLYDLMLGQSGTAADNVVVWSVQRQTAAGTITSVTPRPLDPSDPASTTTGGSNASAEGTITANSDLLTVAFNQRGTYRWMAPPGGELIVPATANNGLAVLVKSAAYQGAAGGTLHFEE